MIERLFQKRVNHFLEHLEKTEVTIDKQILKKMHAVRLDRIEKKRLVFPRVLYPVRKVPLEWWYFTGHLQSGKRSFGFEYCIFKFNPQDLRIGPIPLSIIKREPYLVFHSSITDKDKGRFMMFQDSGIVHHDKIDYSSLDLSINKARLSFKKKFKIDSESMSLELTPVKKVVRHFDHGYAVMFRHPVHRTYYVTLPRLKVGGKIRIKNKGYRVNGIAWFDHQKANMPLKTTLKGWDWFSIIFDDNTELMFFTLRSKKGLVHKYMGGSFIKKDSSVIHLSQRDAEIRHLSTWKSPKTDVIYPSGWHMKIEKLKLDLRIIPSIKNQEMDVILTTPTSYWEGACDVKGKKGGKKITGKSYVELVGYDDRILSNFLKSVSY